MVVKSLKDKIRNNFNISIAETDHHDKWQRTKLAVANVNIDRATAQAQLDKVVKFIDTFDRVQMLDYKIELL